MSDKLLQDEKSYLKDVSESGKDRKWAERKGHALRLSETYYEAWISDMEHAG